MRLKIRIATAVAVLTAGALALSGCTGAGGAVDEGGGEIDTTAELSGTIKFQSWSLKNEKFSPYFEAAIAAFEKEHPQVKIEWLDQPGDGYQDKVLSQANSNTLPDVINLPPDIAYPLVAAGKLVDLAKADPNLEKTYVPGAWTAYTYPGTEGTWGLPWYLGTDLNYWNGAELKKYGVDTTKLPTTTEELTAMAIQVGEASKGKMPLISAMPGLEVFGSNDVPILNDQGQFVFNTDKAASLVDQYTAAYKAGALPLEALKGDDGSNADMFKQGKVAFTSGGPGYAGDLLRDAPSIRKSVIVTPRIGIPPLFVQGLSVSNDSQNKAAALAFATYLTNTENQMAFVKLALGFMPGTVEGSADVAALSATVTDPLQKETMAILSEEMKTAKVIMPFQWTGAMKTYMDQQLALAIKGEIPSKEALDKIVKYANDNLIDK